MQQTQSKQPPTPPTKPRPVTVPPWPIERFIGYFGRFTTKLGKALDALAKGPPPISWIVKLFSSVWLGVTWLFLIGAYIGVGSGMSWVRVQFEMTDLQFFDAWPMRVLLALLTINLTVVTLRRIPLNIFKLGVWMVHVGIITLMASCVVYFSLKQEGAVRIFLHQSVDHFYDVTERAIYVKMPGAKDFSMTPLPDLPIYYEHLASLGNPLNMPVTPDATGLNLRITGYYPYAQFGDSDSWAAGPANAPDNPGIEFHTIIGENRSPQHWLIAKNPAARVDDQPNRFGMEYLYHPTASRAAEVTAEFDGQAAVTVRIPSLGIDRVYVARPGVPIVVEGSPYVLTPDSLMPSMPMLSKGYEHAASTALMVAVERKNPDGTKFNFNRMAVFRYPERSPDFVQVDGKQVRKQDGVDSAIQIVFHDATRDQLWILEDDAGQRKLVQRAAGGKVTTQPIVVGKPMDIALAGVPAFQWVLDGATPHAIKVVEPKIIPPAQRPLHQTAMDAISFSMLELEISKGDWHSGKVYVPFAQFAATELPYGPPPTKADVPGVGPVELVFSTTQRPLPSTVTLEDFNAIKDTHTTRTYVNYISTLRVKDKANLDSGDGDVLIAQLNSPAVDHGLTYFQAEWDGHDNPAPGERFSVIGVGNHVGLHGMIVGALLIFVGIGYAFYIKPILLNVKKQQLAAAAKRN